MTKKIIQPRILIFLFLFFIALQDVFCQQQVNLVFYNLENLFDTVDDPHANDEEFLPGGGRHWTKKRLAEKINRLAKVFLTSCEMNVPDIIGVCEVESRYVLECLTERSPLKKFNYDIIHKDSPDPRGIDVALLYRSDQCKPVSYEYFPLVDERGQKIRTREILHAVFQLPKSDTLHVFVNHWPSRYGGQLETEQKRITAAKCLRRKIDQLFEQNDKPKIVLMGDFNDEPTNSSISKYLNARSPSDSLVGNEVIVNLSASWKTKGTIKHQESWAVFDQLMVTKFLLDSTVGWKTSIEGAQVLDFDFLLQPDTKFQGQKLFRTYTGFKYNGGYSDHLPVQLKLTYSY